MAPGVHVPGTTEFLVQGQVGDGSAYSTDGLNQWTANLLREFQLPERFKLQLRADAINLQNRWQMNPPEVSPTSTNRFYQFQMRLQFWYNFARLRNASWRI